jgi:hypothetical protein
MTPAGPGGGAAAVPSEPRPLDSVRGDETEGDESDGEAGEAAEARAGAAAAMVGRAPADDQRDTEARLRAAAEAAGPGCSGSGDGLDGPWPSLMAGGGALGWLPLCVYRAAYRVRVKAARGGSGGIGPAGAGGGGASTAGGGGERPPVARLLLRAETPGRATEAAVEAVASAGVANEAAEVLEWREQWAPRLEVGQWAGALEGRAAVSWPAYACTSVGGPKPTSATALIVPVVRRAVHVEHLLRRQCAPTRRRDAGTLGGGALQPRTAAWRGGCRGPGFVDGREGRELAACRAAPAAACWHGQLAVRVLARRAQVQRQLCAPGTRQALAGTKRSCGSAVARL